jgi:RHH-type rel operon transcriptional repressor/antitoxin RelB
MLSIRLNAEMDSRLSALAAITKRSKSFYVKEALEMHMDNLSDIYTALDRISDPNRVLLSTEELLKGLNIKNV